VALNVEIRTIDHGAQRYPTVGDWYYDGEKLVILVSDLGDWKKEALVAVHELIEVLLCGARGITQEQVDQFDQKFEASRQAGNVDEPGDDPKAPYRKEHFFATNIERLLCTEFGLVWADYNQQIEDL